MHLFCCLGPVHRRIRGEASSPHVVPKEPNRHLELGNLPGCLKIGEVVDFGWGSGELLPDFTESIEVVHQFFAILQSAPAEAGSDHHARFVGIYGVESQSQGFPHPAKIVEVVDVCRHSWRTCCLDDFESGSRSFAIISSNIVYRIQAG